MKKVALPKPARIVIYVIAGMLLLYSLLGFLVIPITLKWALLKKAPAYLQQHQFYVRRIHFQPFSLTLTINNLELLDPSGGRLAGFDGFTVDFEFSSLWSDAWKFKTICLDKPYVRVVLYKDGKLNLLAIAPPTQPQAAPKKVEERPQIRTKEEQPPKAVQVSHLSVTDGTLFFRDETRERPIDLAVRPIGTVLENFTTHLDKSSGLNLTLLSGKQGSINVKGACSLDPLQCFLKLDVTALALATIQPYLETAVPIELRNGLLDLKGEISYRSAETNNQGIGFAGDVKLSSFEVVDLKTKQELLGWDAFAIDKIDLSLSDRFVNVGDVRWDGLVVRAVLEEDGQLNFLRLAKPAPDGKPPAPAPQPQKETKSIATPAPGTEQSPDFQFLVKQFQMTRGDIHFTDQSVKPAFQVHLSDLNFQLSPISSQKDQRSDFALKCALDKKGTIEVSGFAHLLDIPAAKALKLSLQDYETSALSPYFGKYLGRAIADGRLQVEVNYDVAPTQFTAKHRLLLKKFTLGQSVESPTAIRFPIGFVLSLLEDSQQRIDLSVPAKGDPSDPEFKYGHIILYAFKNLFLKMITSPFSILAGLAGTSETEPLDYAGFRPGTAVMPETEQAKLLKVAEVLRDRPKLLLEIQGGYDPQTDIAAIKLSAYQDAYNAMMKESKREEEIILETMFKKYVGWRPLTDLRAKYRAAARAQKSKDIDRAAFYQEVRKQLVEQFQVPQEVLKALSDNRAQEVKDLFISKGELPEERIQIKSNLEQTTSFNELVKIQLGLTSRE